MGLVALNVFLLLRGGHDGHGLVTNLVVAIALLFHHIAHRYITVGWPRKAMLGLSYVWTGFAFVYMIWLIE